MTDNKELILQNNDYAISLLVKKNNIPESQVKQYLSLKDGLLIKQMSDADIAKNIELIVKKLYVLLNHNTLDENLMPILIKEMSIDIKNMFPLITIDEAWYAVKNGYYGNIKMDRQPTSVSAINIINCISTYYHSFRNQVDRINFEYKQQINLIEESKHKVEPPKTKIDEAKADIVITQYNNFCNKKSCFGYSIIYDYLEEIGIINISNEEKENICNLISERIIDSKTREIEYSKRQEFEQYIIELESNSEKKQNEVLRIFKEREVLKIFKKWNENNYYLHFSNSKIVPVSTSEL